jgi:hypothetical protein
MREWIRLVKNQRFILLAAVILIFFGVAFLILSGMINSILIPHTANKKTTGTITIWIPLPSTPKNITKYHVASQENDTTYFSVTNLEQVRPNVTSEIDAPDVIPKALEKYGGLPDEAILVYNKTGYLEGYEGSDFLFFPDRLIAKDPVSTDVFYGRKLNGIKVTGDGGFIKIILGNDGELLYLNKVWRTVEPEGTEKVIPVSKAIEKLGRGEVLDSLKCFCDLNVDRIYIAYWEKGAGVPQEYLDPVWVFSGTTASGEVINFNVYAREEGSLPISPVSSPATVQTGTSVVTLTKSESSITPVKTGNIS